MHIMRPSVPTPPACYLPVRRSGKEVKHDSVRAGHTIWALEGAVSAAILSFGEFEVGGATLAGTESSGWALGLRLGVRTRS